MNHSLDELEDFLHYTVEIVAGRREGEEDMGELEGQVDLNIYLYCIYMIAQFIWHK